MVLLPVPLVVLLRDLGPLPEQKLRTTLWAKGTRIVSDVTLQPIKPGDIPPGGLISCVPEGLDEVEEEQGNLNARAKAPIILVRMRPDEIRSEQGENWDYEGILAYSKICTHVGCPIALYEQQTHHLLCPCHQSTFDLADSGNVVFGPAARRMPQLADHRGRRRLPRRARTTSPNRSARASGSVDERRDQGRGGHGRLPRRPPRLHQVAEEATWARSSRTTGRSCSARSRSTASSCCC